MPRFIKGEVIDFYQARHDYRPGLFTALCQAPLNQEAIKPDFVILILCGRDPLPPLRSLTYPDHTFP